MNHSKAHRSECTQEDVLTSLPVPHESTVLNRSAEWTGSHSGKVVSTNLKFSTTLKKCMLPLATNDGLVLHANCINGILIVVQVNKVYFRKQPARTLGIIQEDWIQIGMLPRERITRGYLIGVHGAKVTVEGEVGVLYAELWKIESPKTSTDIITRIMASCFFCNPGLNYNKHDVFELETIDGCVEDVKFCIVPDFSLYVCVSTNANPLSYRGNVKKYSIGTDLKGVRSMKEVMFTIWPLTYLNCVSEKNGTIVGRNGMLMMLWNYKTDYVWSTFRLDDPYIENRFALLQLHWVTEKQGFLYAVFEDVRKLELIVLNIKSTALKIISEFIIPDGYERLMGVTIDDRIMVALFKNGIIRWNIQHGHKISETILTDVKEAFLGMEHAIIVKSDNSSLETYSFE